MPKVLRLNKGAEECLLEFLGFLLESGKVSGVFTLRKVGESGGVAHSLITDPDTLKEALIYGVKNRFRQIILTTLSTVAGLTPLLLETSFQAQFLKPMTITVVFGLVASTFLIVLLIPALTVIRADILGAMGRVEKGMHQQ